MQLPALSVLKIQNSLIFEKVTNLAVPVGSLAVSMLILLLIVWPKFTEVLRLKTATAELTTRVQSMDSKVNVLRNLDQIELEEQLASSEQMLPSDKGVFTFIEQIESAAANSGVLLNRLEVSPGSLSGTVENKPQPAPTASSPESKGADLINTKVQLKASISGDYNSFMQFLKILRSMPRIVAVEDLSIGSSLSTSGSSQIRVSLQIEAYWKPMITQLSNIEAPVTELTESEKNLLAKIKTEIANIPSGPPVAPAPSVPLGRPDLFAPF